MRGIVIKSFGIEYIVKTLNGNLIKSSIKGKFRKEDIKSTSPIVVGDNVLLNKNDKSWFIEELLPRKNFVVRKSVKLSKQSHIIASNIDLVFLMVTISSPETSTNFIDRFLVSIRHSKIDVCIIFNKLDIYCKESKLIHDKLSKLYKKIGYKCISISVLKDNLNSIKTLMKSKISVIAGHSGVGKSSLINMLQPNLELLTNKISKSHNQGKHTTTFSEMHDLDFGASIIDTPGIKGFGLFNIEKKQLKNYFKEFYSNQNKCKFKNCMHLKEPGCEIKKMLVNGKISESRYNNYKKMLKDELNLR